MAVRRRFSSKRPGGEAPAESEGGASVARANPGGCAPAAGGGAPAGAKKRRTVVPLPRPHKKNKKTPLQNAIKAGLVPKARKPYALFTQHILNDLPPAERKPSVTLHGCTSVQLAESQLSASPQKVIPTDAEPGFRFTIVAFACGETYASSYEWMAPPSCAPPCGGRVALGLRAPAPTGPRTLTGYMCIQYYI